MLKNKKGELSMTMIVTAVIAIVILVVIIFLVMDSSSGVRDATGCGLKGGVCVDNSVYCGEAIVTYTSEPLCPDDGICCKVGTVRTN